MMDSSASPAARAQRYGTSARCTHPPAACAFNPTCTVAVISTMKGLRPFELLPDAAATHPRGPIARSLMPPPLHDSLPPHGNGDVGAAQPVRRVSAVTGAAPAPPRALWDTPVYVAAVAGESSVVAVVFRTRPAIHTPPTHTMATPMDGVRHGLHGSNEAREAARSSLPPDALPSHEDSNGAAPVPVVVGERDGEGNDGGQANSSPASSSSSFSSSPAAADPASPFPSPSPPPAAATAAATAPPTTTSMELLAAEAEARRTVYLFDASTGLCLAALHFSGSPVVSLRLNAAVLLVAASDVFHLVELHTLRYVRQQNMHKPPNPRAVLDLSSAVCVKGKRTGSASGAAAQHATPSTPPSTKPAGPQWQQYSYAVAFPQSARGYRGDVTVLTLHTSPPPSPQRPAPAPDSAAQQQQQQRTISAHHHGIAHLRLRHDGRLLVTASTLGTTLKLFDCATGSLLVELQRGHRPASVLSLGLQADAYRIAALSTNGTLHVFNCAAVVQAWAAGRRSSAAAVTNGSSATTAAFAPASKAAVISSPLHKARADFKLKVPPLYTTSTRGVAAGAGKAVTRDGHDTTANTTEHHTAGGTSLPSDGSVCHVVGFTEDGRTVWVAQVESTDTQLALASLRCGGDRNGTSAGSFRRNSETTTRDETQRRTHNGATGVQQTRCIGKLSRFPLLPHRRGELGNVEVEAVSYSIEM